jgi:hypothetical protein
MTDDLPGPSLGELRAASATLMASGLALSMFPHALKAAADHEQYVVRAATIGVDRETAERVADAVRDELLKTGRPPRPAYTIALQRLLDQPGERPRDELRDVARQVLRAGGESDDPESVDRVARGIAPMVGAEDRHTHRCDERCTCPADGQPMFYAPSTGQHACQDPDCEHAHPQTRDA